MFSWVISPGTVPIKKKILFPCMSSFVLTCTFLIPLIHGAEETFCQDEVTFRGQESWSLCFIQALLVSFFGLSTAIWWFCHIVHLFLRFVVYVVIDSTFSSPRKLYIRKYLLKLQIRIDKSTRLFKTLVLLRNSCIWYPVVHNFSTCHWRYFGICTSDILLYIQEQT